MKFLPTRVPYRQTNAFSRIVLDYIDQAKELKPFFTNAPSYQGIMNAIASREAFPTNRKLLVDVLRTQYKDVSNSDKVKANIEKLLDANCFTVTTAHQNNLFTGPLYFIYKIVHAIKLADELNTSIKDKTFVPVFYIGTEDADLQELDHIYLANEKLEWNTRQTGAVGRMVIDKELLKLIDRVEGELGVLPFGKELTGKLRSFYKTGSTIQQATFEFVNDLFAEYGLVVLLPDNALLKAGMKQVFEDDLLHQTASSIVEKTAANLEKASYKVQANPREINLFYLEGDKRERIEKRNDHFILIDSQRSFTQEQLLNELVEYPERFSPNVILRGLFQETILPNIAFIGGGGELAYWMQLKDLFDHYKVPFPVLILRNSFLIAEKKWNMMVRKLGFTLEDLFKNEQELMNELVRRESKHPVQLNGAMLELQQLYDSFKQQASTIDPTLEIHVEALKKGVLHRLQELEKKMLRAERRKFSDQQRQLHTISGQLFPNKGLQERRENLGYYYSKWGREFIHAIYNASLGMEQEFVVLVEV